MSGPVHLETIRLRNFRAFGEESFELPKSGLLLLSGANGMGKSTLFDAIEWALVGSLEKLDLPKDELLVPDRDPYARRVRGPHATTFASSYEVHIGFRRTLADASTPYSVFRRGGCTPKGDRDDGSSEATAAWDVVKLLADSQNGQQLVDALERAATSAQSIPLLSYLQLTHIFPQSVRQRLTSRSPSERWALLEGPLNVDVLHRTRARMTKAAEGLSTLDNIAADRILRATNRLQDFDTLRSERDDLRDSTRGTMALEPRDAMQTIDECLVTLRRRSAFPTTMDYSSAEARRRLSELKRVLDEDAGLIASRLQRLNDSKELPEKWRSVSGRKLDALAKRSSTMATLELARKARHAALQPIEVRTRQRAEVAQALPERRTLHGTIGQRLRLLGELASLTVERSSESLAHKVSGARERLRTAVDANKDARARLDEHDRVKADLTLASERVAQWERRSVAVAGLIEQAEKAAGRRTRIETLRATIAHKVDAVQVLEEKRVAAVRAQEEAEAEAKSLEFASAELAAAVARVAALIGECDETCPVCSTPHPKGRLKERAAAAAKAMDPRLATVRERVAAFGRDIATLVRDIDVFASESTSLQREAASIAGEIEAVATSLKVMASEIGASNTPEALRAAATAGLVQASESREAAASRLVGFPGRVVLADAVTTTASAASEAAAAVATIDARVVALDRRLGELRATVHAPIEGIDPADDAAALEATLAIVGADIERLEHAATELEAQRPADDAARARHANDESRLVSELRQIEADLVELDATVAEFTAEWGRLELAGEPSDASLAAAHGLLGERRSRAAAAEDLRQRVDGGLTAWDGLSQLQETESTLQRLVDVSSEEEYRARLEANRGELELERKRIDRARKECTWLFGRFKDEESSFNDRVLVPLASGMQAYWRVLGSTDRIDLHVTTSARKRRQYSVMDPDGARDPAALIASEGEMATQALCMLLAASTRYRWSAWRALLLDDPLAHCDLVKTASLVDLMRNLASEEQYQIMFSTHDDMIARYIERKMHAAGVPCHHYRFDAKRRESGVGVTRVG